MICAGKPPKANDISPEVSSLISGFSTLMNEFELNY